MKAINISIDIPLEPEHISAYLISERGIVLGATRLRIGACREIKTEAGQMVGWFVPRVEISVIQQGIALIFLFVLPDGQRLFSRMQDHGLDVVLAPVGAIVAIDDLRLIHPQAKKVVIGEKK